MVQLHIHTHNLQASRNDARSYVFQNGWLGLYWMWNLLPFLKPLDIEVGIQSNTVSKRYIYNLFLYEVLWFYWNIAELFWDIEMPQTAQKNGLTQASFHYPILLNIFFIFCFLGLLYFSQLETWYFAKNLFAFHRHVYISQKGCVPWFYHLSKVKWYIHSYSTVQHRLMSKVTLLYTRIHIYAN